MSQKNILPSSFTAKNGEISPLGVGLFVLSAGVLIYQIYFYNVYISNVKKNSDINERLSRLERLVAESEQSDKFI
jgi:hypothetical protein